MNIYYYISEKGDRIFSEPLIKKALKLYNIEYGLGLSEEDIEKEKIRRTQKGKPSFEEISIEFSISHSGNIWVCVVGHCKAGIDIQIEKTAKTHEIAKRFFTKEESDFVLLNGPAAFFKIWAKKEAFVKFTGEGISYGFDKFSVVFDEKLIDAMETPLKCHFQEIDLNESFKCYLCTTEKEKVYIRNL